MTIDRRGLLLQAVQLSAEKMRAGLGGPFGAVIARDGIVIAKGSNQVTSLNDPTAHAEVQAIRAACQTLDDHSLAGCEIYSSCEPCPMCLSAIYWARLDRIFFANSRADAAAIGFDDDHIYSEIPKDIAARAIPTTQIALDEAAEIFQEWQAMPDKIMY